MPEPTNGTLTIDYKEQTLIRKDNAFFAFEKQNCFYYNAQVVFSDQKYLMGPTESP